MGGPSLILIASFDVCCALQVRVTQALVSNSTECSVFEILNSQQL